MIEPERLYEMLAEHFPVCWYDFSEMSAEDRPKHPPYCAILEETAETVDADDEVYYSEAAYTVELYTVRRDYSSEKLIERLFRKNGIYYRKSARIYLKEEKKMQIIYSI